MKAREYGIINHDVDNFAPRAFFSTLTNVNFDSPRIVGYAREAIALREALKAQCLSVDANAHCDNPMADLQLVSDDLGELQRQAAEFTPNKDKAAIGENILGLRLLCLYGLKGAAAYMEHAHVLGQYDNDIYAQYHKIMAWLGTWPADMNALLECAMEIGQMNFKVMSILDAGETTKYGHPTPTQVNVKATEGKCILISGHDLKDLYNLLEQTEGTGVNVYTHGEMLPAHGYPELRKFKHLVGNYGSGWQNQQVEFARFPGPIVMTSNCIIDPTVGSYDDRIWAVASSAGRALAILKAMTSGRSLPRRSRWRASRTAKFRILSPSVLAVRPCSALPIRSSIWSVVKNCATSSWSAAVTARAASVTTLPISPPACRMTA